MRQRASPVGIGLWQDPSVLLCKEVEPQGIGEGQRCPCGCNWTTAELTKPRLGKWGLGASWMLEKNVSAGGRLLIKLQQSGVRYRSGRR